ncbi:MAG TPA: flavodoxin family protein [Deltaproteobacteria bacterium]|nr:flavodoxin family protein [Deltaproteobacteria bacterium]
MKNGKKVLVLLGSPRREGNSAILAEMISKGAMLAEGKVETVFLHELNIAPCKSCYACQRPRSRGCSIDDDMQQIYKEMLLADVWVIATPVYWFNMSAQTKLWMDRCFALPAYEKKPFLNKKIAIAMSYGGDDPFDSGCVNALRTFQDAFSYVGAKIVGMVYGSAMDAGDIKADETLMAKAEKLGKHLVSDDG